MLLYIPTIFPTNVRTILDPNIYMGSGPRPRPRPGTIGPVGPGTVGRTLAHGAVWDPDLMDPGSGPRLMGAGPGSQTQRRHMLCVFPTMLALWVSLLSQRLHYGYYLM